MKNKTDTLLKSWAKLQQLRRINKMNKMVSVNVVIFATDGQYEAQLDINQGLVLITPHQTLRRIVCFNETRLQGCQEEGHKLILNSRCNEPSIEIHFANNDTMECALVLIRAIIRDESSDSAHSSSDSSE